MSSSAENLNWLFGYGSLVAPESMASTIGRPVARDEHFVPAFLDGYARRWNYGSMNLRGDWDHDGGTVEGGVVISLGLIAADDRCNGVAVVVTDEEIAALDWRERDYDRVDVTELTAADPALSDSTLPGTVYAYVPRPSAVERYEAARDEGRAAIRLSYWDLVHNAFAELNDDHAAQMLATPAPDVPVADIRLYKSELG